MNPYGPEPTVMRDPNTTGPFIMPLLTAEQFHGMTHAQLRTVFELAENVEHVTLWSAVKGTFYQIGRGRRPPPPPLFTGWARA